MLADATRAWVEGRLAPGERIAAIRPLRGGWTSRMCRLTVEGPDGERALVLRSFLTPFFRRHAPGLLTREHRVLGLLAGTPVPAPGPVAVDADGRRCAEPSLLMTLLPGAVRLAEDGGVGARVEALAAALCAVHRVAAEGPDRPRAYQAWTAPERVRVPKATARPALWRRAVAAIDRPAPAWRGSFLHRDFHPGNVLFDGAGRVSGVVDWVETSWGPTDLDVAHCATALALLHGPEVGLAFPRRYLAAGGALAERAEDRRYWRLLDALAYAPEAEKVAGPWRELGRTDLTAGVLAGRLEEYLAGVVDGPA
ncbi:phosphotransferase family protein [Streptomyces triticirhizae]|uniref:phosphotransferase family protein n=1 Tax=Streptomyces triticirhizae TaxID=2483353 RepID=UPI001F164F02|nr:aminoglycoside phosphotransferase family protein [Streptomyces triticirhizae]